MEIVTEPDIRTAEQARRYAEELQLLLRSIGASDADMERGQMRVEANVSLRVRGAEAFGTRVEVKNMNSFRAVERAIAFEIERQAAALDAGEPLVQETRGWSEERGATYRMRVKETSDDYRYFPEPDLPPLHLDAAWLDEVRAGLPELPAARRTRYRELMGLSPYDASVLVADPGRHARCSKATLAAVPGLEPKPVANWVTGEYLRAPECGDRAGHGLGRRARRRSSRRSAPAPSRGRRAGRSSRRTSPPVGPRPRSSPSAASARSRTVARSAAAVDAALAANPAAVADYRAGKAQAIGFLVGQVMKATGGQANAAAVKEAVRARLDDERDREG